jgi:transposase
MATAETLSHREAWERIGISRRTFYELKARGHFDHLLTPEGRISAKKLAIHLHGHAAHVSPLQGVA